MFKCSYWCFLSDPGKWIFHWKNEIITTATNRVKWILKTMFELMLTKMTQPNLNLVNDLTPLGLWKLKIVLPEGRMKFKSVFLKIIKLSITAEEKKEFWKKLCFNLNRGILLVFLVLYVLTEVGIILKRYFGHLYLEILKKQHSFLYHLLLPRVFKPSSLYSFSLDAPLIAPVIANAALYWIESSF